MGPRSSDLNPIENLWSIVKIKSYRESKQYNSKADLLGAIKVPYWKLNYLK